MKLLAVLAVCWLAAAVMVVLANYLLRENAVWIEDHVETRWDREGDLWGLTAEEMRPSAWEEANLELSEEYASGGDAEDVDPEIVS